MTRGEIKLKLVVGKAGKGRMLHIAGLAKQSIEEDKRVLVVSQELYPDDFIRSYMGMSITAVAPLVRDNWLRVVNVGGLGDAVSELVKDDYDVALINLVPETIPTSNVRMANMLAMDVLESLSRVLEKNMYLSIQLPDSAFIDDGICVWSMGDFNNYLFKASQVGQVPHNVLPKDNEDFYQELLCDRHAAEVEAVPTGVRIRGWGHCFFCKNSTNTIYKW